MAKLTQNLEASKSAEVCDLAGLVLCGQAMRLKVRACVEDCRLTIKIFKIDGLLLARTLGPTR